jgi:hypothetical protein
LASRRRLRRLRRHQAADSLPESFRTRWDFLLRAPPTLKALKLIAGQSYLDGGAGFEIGMHLQILPAAFLQEDRNLSQATDPAAAYSFRNRKQMRG